MIQDYKIFKQSNSIIWHKFLFLIVLSPFWFFSTSGFGAGLEDWRFFVDTSEVLDHEEVYNNDKSFIPSETQLFNFGFSQEPVWLRTKVSTNENMTLLISNPLISNVSFYLYAEGALIKKEQYNYLRNLASDIVLHPMLMFDIPAGIDGELIIRVQSTEALIIPIETYASAELPNVVMKKQSIGYMIVGLMFTLSLLYIFFFISLRDRAYFFYLLYAFAVVLTVLRTNGLLYYWFPVHDFFDSYSSMFETWPAITAGLFTIHYLRLKHYSRAMYNVIRVMVVLQISSLFISLLGYNMFAFIFTDLIAFAFMPIALGLSFWLWRVKKYGPAKFYLLGWTFLFAGALVFILRNLGIIQYDSILLAHSLDIGIAVEMLLLSVGLSSRVDLLRTENSELLAENLRIVGKQKEELQQEVDARTKELSVQNREVLNAYRELEIKNKSILDSINYAKRIQNALLPSSEAVQDHLKNSFILYLPKDVVAGDFYWLENFEGTTLFAAADCTGHGVPGAMVSVVCSNSLNKSVRDFGLIDPGEILNKTREIVTKEFEKSEDDIQDGMDIALCALNGNFMSYAGALNPLFIVRKDLKEVEEIKPNRQSIGKHEFNQSYTTHVIELNKGDSVYVFSDGLQDQFGGPNGKKFMVKRFKELLISVQSKSMEEQKETILKAFNSWKGKEDQVDDVCVIGVRI